MKIKRFLASNKSKFWIAALTSCIISTITVTLMYVVFTSSVPFKIITFSTFGLMFVAVLVWYLSCMFDREINIYDFESESKNNIENILNEHAANHQKGLLLLKEYARIKEEDPDNYTKASEYAYEKISKYFEENSLSISEYVANNEFSIPEWNFGIQEQIL